MTSSRPATVEAYRPWASNHFGVAHDDTLKRWYETNATATLNAAENHQFFGQLRAALELLENDYRAKHAVDLLMDRELVLKTKPFESMIDKSLRRNVLENPGFPDAPHGGWLEPATWFERNNDIARGVLTCKYIDGPRTVAERLAQSADALSLPNRSKSQQNDDGYYAYHFYVRIPVEMTAFDWTSRSVNVEVEVQLTTQLQEVLRALTHRLYEDRRLAPSADPHSWKWEVQTDRFRAAYLGHSLHMLEAMILDLRLGANRHE